MTVKNEYVRIFKAFSDENRVRVLELLQDGEKCACILLEDLNINQSTLSHHMKILCESGIVRSRPVGKWSYYSIDDSGCTYAKELIMKLTEKKLAGMNFLSWKLNRTVFLYCCILNTIWIDHWQDKKMSRRILHIGG